MDTVYVVILAAGRGKRFWPFETNKALIRFFGKPLIVHNLERFARAGFRKVILVINPADVQFYMDLVVPDMEIHTVIQQEAVGMGDALLRVREHIGNAPMLVVNAEDVVSPDLYNELASNVDTGVSFLVGKKVDRYFDLGYLETHGDRVTGIVEKPGDGNQPSDLVNLVFHYVDKPADFFDILARQTSEQDDVYERALDTLLKKSPFQFISYEDIWLPLKYPWHLLDMSTYFLTRMAKEYRGKNIHVAPSAILDGPIHIEDNVKIFDNTKIVGPVYIGKNTIIGNNSMIRESHIGGGCVIGFNSDITRSYIGDNCWFHSNYVGDSVLEENVSIGSGSVLANLRLDEGEISSVVGGKKLGTGRSKLGAMIGSFVRIGVNASIMPGVKIGADSFVGAGITVSTDIPEQSFVSGTSDMTIAKNTKRVRELSRDSYKKKLSS